MRFKPGDIVRDTGYHQVSILRILPNMRYEVLRHDPNPQLIGLEYDDDGDWPDGWCLDETYKITQILTKYDS